MITMRKSTMTSPDTTIAADAAVAWLEEAARYFEHRDTRGDDSAHWSNVYNAENCRRIAALIQHLSRGRTNDEQP